MRTIKFRAWHKKEKKMLTGEPYEYSDSDEYYGSDFGVFLGGLEGLQEDKNIILMQYTGLKDSKGVEIYEGDIVRNTFGKYRKVVASKMKVVKFQYKHRYSGYGLAKETKGYEVIGNIYENLELLK